MAQMPRMLSIEIDRKSLLKRRSLMGKLIKKNSKMTDSIKSIQSVPALLSEKSVANKIENYVGTIPLPRGLCGPVGMDGEFAKGSFVVPMATLEGTLLASYSRGCRIMDECAKKLGHSGVEAWVFDDYFLRCTNFVTRNLKDSIQLMKWLQENKQKMIDCANAGDRFLNVKEMSFEAVADVVTVSMKLETFDAMGSNMGSKAANDVYSVVMQDPFASKFVKDALIPYPEDKKYIPNRLKGKKVIVRTVLEKEVFERMTRTTLETYHEFVRNFRNMLAYHQSSAMNIHTNNGLAAMFLAFGQDAAYLGESASNIVEAKFVDREHTQLAVTLTLPGLIIGSVGGGTGLPAYQSNLAVVGCDGYGNSKKLAEIMGAIALAGEVSCGAAQCSGEFVVAHETMCKNDPLKEETKETQKREIDDSDDGNESPPEDGSNESSYDTHGRLKDGIEVGCHAPLTTYNCCSKKEEPFTYRW